MLEHADSTDNLGDDRLDVTPEQAERQAFLTTDNSEDNHIALTSGPSAPEVEEEQSVPLVTETSFDRQDSYTAALTRSRQPSTTGSYIQKRLSTTSVQLEAEGTTEEEANMALSEVCQAHKFKFISAITVGLLAIITAVCLSTLHSVNEGNVGIYYKYGALMDRTTNPGIHWMAPFITSVKMVMVRDQTDTLHPIIAVTRDGIENTFNDVQVISRVRVSELIPMVRKYGLQFRDALIYDRIREELRIVCANSTIDDVYNTKFLEIAPHVKNQLIESIERLGNGGIEILNLVISKPQIPQDIANNYKAVKVQWTEQRVATQQQKTEKIKKETEKVKAIADAERSKAVLQIQIEQQILEREGNRNVSTIENQIRAEKEKNIADIAKYKAQKEAESNNLLLTDQYIKLHMAKALAENTKMYFSGDNSELGGLLSKIFDKNK